MAHLELRFRKAEPPDVDPVVRLVESAYRGEQSRLGWTTEADLLEGQRTDRGQVTELIAKTGSVVLLAELPGAGPGQSSGEIVGCCHLEALGEEVAYFGMFAVAPTRQGAGIGKALLAEAKRMAAGWGCQVMRMTVIRQRADLIAWYARHGFAPTGEREPFPYADRRFGTPRREDLEFVVLAGPTEPA